MKKKNLKKSLIVVLIIAVIFGSLPLCSCKNISSSIKSGLRSVAVKSEENFEVEKQEKISDNELASSGQCGDKNKLFLKESTS